MVVALMNGLPRAAWRAARTPHDDDELLQLGARGKPPRAVVNSQGRRRRGGCRFDGPRLCSEGTAMSTSFLACAGCRELEARIEKLQARLAELEAENARLRLQAETREREQTRQANRFRRRILKKRRKRPGRKRGHVAAVRPTPTPDRVVDVPLPECPDCHAPLYDRSTVIQFQTDLPPIVPVVTQFNLQTGYCTCCHEYRRARHPEQISDAIGSAGNTLGPVILSMAAELKHRLGVPYRKICDFFATYYDLEICPATFVRAEQRLTDKALPTYQLLLDALRRAHVVHADETGWRIGRLNAWLWVFSSKDTTVYVIRRSRGHDVPEEILGAEFDGYLVVDGLHVYDVLDIAKGRCNAHLLRRCKALGETMPSSAVRHVHALAKLMQKAIRLAERRTQLDSGLYTRRVQAIEDALDDWLDRVPLAVNDDLDRLVNHVASHRGEWLIFLHDADVPPTNNHAEQMLRPAVITRKVGGCNKTLLGAVVHGVLASLMVSCKRQGHRFLDLAKRLWQSEQTPAIPLDSLPAHT
jgi:transposase